MISLLPSIRHTLFHRYICIKYFYLLISVRHINFIFFFIPIRGICCLLCLFGCFFSVYWSEYLQMLNREISYWTIDRQEQKYCVVNYVVKESEGKKSTKWWGKNYHRTALNVHGINKKIYITICQMDKKK